MKKIITFGEVMMRLSTSNFQRFSQAQSLEVNYGGSEANVAISLATLGMPVEHVTAFPSNDLGYSATQQIKQFGVETKNIFYSDGRLGVYYLEHGIGGRSGKVIYDRQGSVFAEIKSGTFDWSKIFENCKWFHFSGITPALSSQAAETCLEAAKAAKAAGITISADLNYRSTLWQYGKKPLEVMPALVEHVDVLLADINASEVMLGVSIKGESIDHKEKYSLLCDALHRKFNNIKKVILSHRTSINATSNVYSGFLWNEGKLFQSKSFDVSPIVDRIGAGDALMAGAIYGCLNFKGDDQKTIDFALAAGAIKHSIPGDYNLASLEEVIQLAGSGAIGIIKR